MDDIDRRIVALLRENARRSFKDIGEDVNLSAPAVKRRVDRLEDDGVIRGYTAIVDPAAFGWHAEAFVASALLHVMAEDTQDLELCLERIRATDGISRTVTEVVLSTLFER
jgi:DNA-binding Lrp family transcriptional regulator